MLPGVLSLRVFESALISFPAFARNLAEESHPAPEPYSFSFSANNDDGSSSAREETGDKDGKVTGFYMLMTSEGQRR